MIVFRQADPRYPFLWDTAAQPPARWHGPGEGPAHYFADTPAGAWAELLRHEEITDPEDAATLRRALWAVEIGDAPAEAVTLPVAVVTGGPETYARCRAWAARRRAAGVTRLLARSAALLPGGATGRHVVDGEEVHATPRNGRVIVVYGEPDALVGWQVVAAGAPPPDVLPNVRSLAIEDR